MRFLSVVVAAVALAAGSVAPASGNPSAAEGPVTYTNPVSTGLGDTFADPAVVRGPDGWWSAVATTDPLREGEGERHLLPTARSSDLVHWEHTGDAFTEETLPAWADVAGGASLWAPDLRYVDGQWRMYYVVTETTLTPETGDGAIGMATAPSPTGPWTDSGAPVVDPRPSPGGGFLWTFDPTHVTDADGAEWLYYGSYNGGIEVVRLDDAGSRAVGEPVRVAVDNAFEGAYVVQRDGWWYLFASSANCCAGPVTGYSVHVGRSRAPTGPFVDAAGNDLTASRTGGTPVLVPNGNRWVGTGHNAVVTDLSGQDWIVYHAIDRADPYLDGTDGVNERPMLLDRLDWVDGWPVVDRGRGASETPRPAPVTASTDRLRGRDGARVQALVSGAGAGAGVEARLPGGSVRAVVTAAGEGSRLEVQVLDRGGRVTAADGVDLPGLEPAAERRISLTVQDGAARASLGDPATADPLAEVSVDLPRAAAAVVTGAGPVALDQGASVVDLTSAPAARVATPVATTLPATPDPVRSTEFDEPLDESWTAVGDVPAQVRDGALHWPVESGDLSGEGRTASLLLQDPPEGDWAVETAVDVSAFGVDDVRNYQQAGLVAFVDDDRWVRLSAVSIWNTRQVELGVEQPYAGRVVSAGSIVGPPGPVTWLRLSRTTDASGEVELTGWSSQDGVTWLRGATWTTPPGSQPRVGLVAHGSTPGTPPAVVSFDHVRWSVD